jgi:hypothetical protein
MKLKSNSLLRQLLVIPALVFLVSFIVISCKNEDKQKEKTDGKDSGTETITGTTTSPGSGEASNLAGTPLSFYSLRLEVDSINKLLNDPNTRRPHNNIKKIIIQSIDSNTNGYNAMGLVAYGVNNKQEIITGPVGFTALPNPTNFGEGAVIMGSQELTFKQLKDILGADKRGGTIDTAKLTPLKFVPQREDIDKHLFYVVSRTVAAAGSSNTNPSPPATPCSGTGCDY